MTRDVTPSCDHTRVSPVGLLLGGQQVDVVGDEELPDPGHRGAPARHELRRAVVRAPALLPQLRGVIISVTAAGGDKVLEH